ncbi:hypothetical protein PR048_022009 [Dryococelus australis]|uniref:Transposase Tc1-like domain-containing protein n=1 Tax=Dryococelus australis TaxID=614101 RepID=A0ABQ9GZU1_9NEOP|nr:hypothetical protein PR048_022009 [Dryococelus australis]
MAPGVLSAVLHFIVNIFTLNTFETNLRTITATACLNFNGRTESHSFCSVCLVSGSKWCGRAGCTQVLAWECLCQWADRPLKNSPSITQERHASGRCQGDYQHLTQGRLPFSYDFQIDEGTTVTERLACSPPTKVNQVQSPSGSPDFCKWESCQLMPLVGGFSQGSPIYHAPSFQRRSIFTSITLIDSQDLAVKSRANFFTSLQIDEAMYIPLRLLNVAWWVDDSACVGEVWNALRVRGRLRVGPACLGRSGCRRPACPLWRLQDVVSLSAVTLRGLWHPETLADTGESPRRLVCGRSAMLQFKLVLFAATRGRLKMAAERCAELQQTKQNRPTCQSAVTYCYTCIGRGGLQQRENTSRPVKVDTFAFDGEPEHAYLCSRLQEHCPAAVGACTRPSLPVCGCTHAMKLTDEEKLAALLIYDECGRNAKQAVKIYGEMCPNRTPISRRTIRSIRTRILSRGDWNSTRVRRKTAKGETDHYHVLARVDGNSRKGTGEPGGVSSEIFRRKIALETLPGRFCGITLSAWKKDRLSEVWTRAKSITLYSADLDHGDIRRRHCAVCDGLETIERVVF